MNGSGPQFSIGFFPFAVGQEKPFQSGPYLGGLMQVLTAAVLAGGTVTFTVPFKPRTAVVYGTGIGSGVYPSRVQVAAGADRRSWVVTFESAQPIGTAVFFF